MQMRVQHLYLSRIPVVGGTAGVGLQRTPYLYQEMISLARGGLKETLWASVWPTSLIYSKNVA